MPDISIQFHALPDELIPLVRQCVLEMNLHFSGILFHPFSVEELADKEIERAILGGSSYRRFVFTEKKITATIHSANELTQQFPGALYLDIGRESPQGLGESWLACRTGEKPINDKWKKIASKLRSITQAGAFAISLTTSATSRLRTHRYTAGAKKLCDQGVPMRPTAGNAVIKLGNGNKLKGSEPFTLGSGAGQAVGQVLNPPKVDNDK